VSLIPIFLYTGETELGYLSGEVSRKLGHKKTQKLNKKYLRFALGG
jgi:hypothetical protein